MKTVFLILYLWHSDQTSHHFHYDNNRAGMNGGPVLRIERMESLRQCDAVGKEVKNLADAQPHGTEPVAYRCIEVSK